LDKLLNDEDIKRKLGEDIIFHFKTDFTNPKGLNLRKTVCHGLSPSNEFDMNAADLVVHALLILSLIK
jgi:hypothetical protein